MIKTSIVAGICTLFPLIMAVGACTEAPKSKVADFESRLRGLVAVSKQIPPEMEAYELFKDQSFVTLYKASKRNLDQIQAILVSQDPIEIKRMAVRVAQCLSESQYFELMRKVHGRSNNELALAELIDPGTEWGTVPYLISESYKENREYQNIVSHVAARHELFSHVDGLLDGTKREMQASEKLTFPPCEQTRR